MPILKTFKTTGNIFTITTAAVSTRYPDPLESMSKDTGIFQTTYATGSINTTFTDQPTSRTTSKSAVSKLFSILTTQPNSNTISSSAGSFDFSRTVTPFLDTSTTQYKDSSTDHMTQGTRTETSSQSTSSRAMSSVSDGTAHSTSLTKSTIEVLTTTGMLTTAATVLQGNDFILTHSISLSV